MDSRPQDGIDSDVKRPLCIFTGSSVAAGWYATGNYGWAQRLGDFLVSNGWAVENVAKPGADARLTVDRFASYVAAKSPTLVIIGLGLWNERLTRRGRAAVLSFLAGLLELVGLCRAIGAHVIIGGVYPNSKYNEKDYELLLETSKELRKWAHKFGVASTDFLTNVDDGSGRWKPGLMSDFIHPNDSGHRLLFENIDLTQFEALKVKPVPNAKL